MRRRTVVMGLGAAAVKLLLAACGEGPPTVNPTWRALPTATNIWPRFQVGQTVESNSASRWIFDQPMSGAKLARKHAIGMELLLIGPAIDEGGGGRWWWPVRVVDENTEGFTLQENLVPRA